MEAAAAKIHVARYHSLPSEEHADSIAYHDEQPDLALYKYVSTHQSAN